MLFSFLSYPAGYKGIKLNVTLFGGSFCKRVPPQMKHKKINTKYCTNDYSIINMLPDIYHHRPK